MGSVGCGRGPWPRARLRLGGGGRAALLGGAAEELLLARGELLAKPQQLELERLRAVLARGLSQRGGELAEPSLELLDLAALECHDLT